MLLELVSPHIFTKKYLNFFHYESEKTFHLVNFNNLLNLTDFFKNQSSVTTRLNV